METKKQLLTDETVRLYVSNLDGTTSVEYLTKFCEDKFGPVLSVCIHQLKKQNPYAFVTFTGTDAAYSAVDQKQLIFFDGRQIPIKKADNWHQPTETDANIAGPSFSSTADRPTDDYNSSPLVSIHDDCLHEIFKYLSPFDAVNVAATCTRLRHFVEENIYKKFVKFAPRLIQDYRKNEFTLGILRTMLLQFGSFVQEIYLDGGMDNDGGDGYLNIVLRYCPNLHTLQLHHSIFGQLDHILLSKLNIKVLELHDCEGINDKWAKFPNNFSELRTLVIDDNEEISENILSECKNLESLELTDCGSVNIKQFYKFCKSNGSSLRTLKLSNCDSLDHTVFKMITKNLLRIEELTIDMMNITAPNQLNCLTKLNYLKKLRIVCGTPMKYIGQYIRKLADHGLLEELAICAGVLNAKSFITIQKFKRLQTLKLINPIIEDEHMMNIIENADFPELRELYCVECDSITDENLVALVTSKRRLAQVDILMSENVTFASVRQIIEVLKSDMAGDRPLLKLNIDTIEIGNEEKKILNYNRDVIIFTNTKKRSKSDEYDADDSDEDFDDDENDENNEDDDDDDNYDEYDDESDD